MMGRMADLHVFIDTNAWLAFYTFTNDDLEQIRKLVAVIKKDKVKLYTSQQLMDEFYRNREKKLQESLTAFTGSGMSKSVPRYMRSFPEMADYDEAMQKLGKLRNGMIARAREEAKSNGLAADKLFADVMKAAPPEKIDNKLISAALDRRLRGNPPGKPDKLGDQIHWEALLRDVPDGADLHIVSKDGDFESPLEKGAAHAFLVDEWREKKKGKLTLHTELKPFFNAHFPTIKLAVNVEKIDAIEQLVNAGFFAATHIAIAQLLVLMDALSWPDADKIFTAGLENNQIRWIGSDKDVREFYQTLIAKFDQKLDPDRKQSLLAVFTKEEVDTGLDGIDWESDPPF